MEEEDLTLLHSSGIVTFVFVCHVQFILMQQKFGGIGRVLLGELPILSCKLRQGGVSESYW